jgi:hypothetical protein
MTLDPFETRFALEQCTTCQGYRLAKYQDPHPVMILLKALVSLTCKETEDKEQPTVCSCQSPTEVLTQQPEGA